MAGKNPRVFTPRDERAHPVIQDAIARGYLERGTAQGRESDPYIIRGFPKWGIANEARRSIYNAAKHLGVSCSSRTREDIIQEEDGSFSVRFWIMSRDSAKRRVLEATGGDPSKLAYNPWKRKNTRLIADDGTRIP